MSVIILFITFASFPEKSDVMKKYFSLLLLAMLSLSAMAQTYCSSSAFGYGAAATGGGNATPTLVSSISELQTALKASGNKVIIITQNLTFTSMMKVKATNKTLLALPGVTLTSLKQDATSSGILYFSSGSSNIILRNLTFVGPGAYDCDGNDLLCFDGVTKAWVDHCDFQDGCDGNFDNKGNTDNITISWCRFRYLKVPKPGGSGGTDDHRFTNLLGSSSSDKPADGTYNITWAYCWWDDGCKQRMVRCRNASLHFLNCYWNSSVADYYIGPENADAYVEGCTINGKPSSKNVFKSYGGTNGSKFVNCSGTVPSNTSGRTVVVPTYAYTALTAAASKTAITSSCGAGATLTVTSAGQVSSACDGGSVTPGPTDPTQPTTPSDPSDPNTTWWNLSDSDFPGVGTISSPTTVRYLTIAADGGSTIQVDESAKSADGYTFTQRYKTGGAGSPTGRHFAFHVSGACTITLYALSSSSSASRTINIAAGAFSQVVGTIDIPANATTLQARSYAYTGGANDIFIYSSASGVNFYGIKVTGATVSDAGTSDITEDDPTLNEPSNKSQTVVRGQAIEPIVFVAGGTATSISVSGLPAGLTSSKNGLTLTISGTPTAEGSYTITAKNRSGGTSYGNGYITIEEPVTPPAGQTTDIVQQSTWWNISDADFRNLGSMTSETVVRQLHIVPSQEETITVDANNKSLDGYSFTHRLKFGGEGSETRQLWFDVKGSCTVEIYMMSSNSTNTRSLNVSVGVFGAVATTLPAATSIAKQTYVYDGPATTLHLYPADGGINVYGIRLTYPQTTDVNQMSGADKAQKILQNGRIFILRDGAIYDIMGNRVVLR